MSLVGGPELLRLGNGSLRIYVAHEHWLVCPTHVLWRFNRKPCDERRRPPQYWGYTGALERRLDDVDVFIARSEFSRVKHREFGFPTAGFAGLLLFSSANQFANLQWNTGVRYMVPLVPLLFLAALPVLASLPRALTLGIVGASGLISIAVSMYREDVTTSLRFCSPRGPRSRCCSYSKKWRAVTTSGCRQACSGSSSPVLVSFCGSRGDHGSHQTCVV